MGAHFGIHALRVTPYRIAILRSLIFNFRLKLGLKVKFHHHFTLPIF